MANVMDMREHTVTVERQSLYVNPDKTRVITRPFVSTDASRVRSILSRVLSIPEEELGELVDRTLRRYEQRHRDIRGVALKHFREVEKYLPDDVEVSEERKQLIGCYFTMEYAVEAAALFNPSMVPHPDQSGLEPDQLRAIISFRATGEGHVSSIEFRQAIIEADGLVRMQPVNRFVATPEVHKDLLYDRHLFHLRLLAISGAPPHPEDADVQSEMTEHIINGVLDQLGDWFTFSELTAAVEEYRQSEHKYPGFVNRMLGRMILLARSNYEMTFPEETDISERVVFPVSDAENHGIEDARFVRLVEDDGSAVYFATYTAFDGSSILTQLLETRDFRYFRVHTLNGRFSNSKGMAFFPRRINGNYAMISRLDGENLFLMYSDNVHFWDEAELLRTPQFPWEMTQIGNCGSPIETEEGWLLITHGVGPMRRYCIGCILLDRERPSQVIGSLSRPLLEPNEEEREGYVPNVVYSCGGLVHNGYLVLPYAVSDMASRIATVPLGELLDALKSGHSALQGSRLE